MSTREKKLFWPIGLLAVATVAIALVSARAITSGIDSAKPPLPVPNSFAGQGSSDAGKTGRAGRAQLARQPAAFRLSMKLGKRFRGRGNAESVLTGTLRRGDDEQSVRIRRRQTDGGERVEVALKNGPASLTWSADEGALSSGSAASAEERLLIERLVLDTPDQFILAQLRGASYQTIARAVRPEGAPDDYSGPVWDIVQVKEPASEAQGGAEASLRLYWINARTGLIDKIVKREGGAEVIATLHGWAEQRGELMPSRIIWTREGQTVMQLDFTGFNYPEQQSQQQ